MFNLDQLIQNHIDSLLALKDAEIAALNEEIMAKNSQIAQLQQQITALTAQVTSQTAQITALQADVVALNATIAERDAQISVLQAQIAELQAQIEPLNAQIVALTADLATANATIATQAQAIADRDAQIATLTSQVNALQAQVVTLTATVAARDAQIVVLQARIAELEAGGPGPTPVPVDPLIEILPLKYQLRRAWFQEDVGEGPVSLWPTRGFPVVNATQGGLISQPVRLPNNGGVQFAVGTTQSLALPYDPEAPWSSRNWIVVARTDQAATSTAIVQLFAVNGTATTPTNRQPYVYFINGKMSSAVFETANRIVSGPARTGYANWNVMVGYRRGDQLFGSINGAVQPQAPCRSLRQNSGGGTGAMGSFGAAMAANAAIDCILVFDGELSDAQVRYLEGWVAWYRVKDATILPANHPWRNTKPVAADLEMPSLFTHDQAKWDAWRVQKNLIRHTHRGEAQPANYADGYKRVFFTDFDRPDQHPQSDLTGDPNSPWFSPGWLTTLGGSNPPTTILQSNGQPWPDAYVQDASATGIRWIYVNGIWHNGAMMGVNNNGYGRRWGPGIYKTKFKFTATKAGADVPMVAPLPGLFPGPLSWGYGWEHLFFRSRNRIEQDYAEYVGVVAGAYAEANLHIHAPRYPMAGQPGVAQGTGQHEEIVGYTANASVGWPHTLNPYDGQWHEQVTKIEPQPGLMTIWIDGVEFGRCPTNDGFEAPRYFVGSHLIDRGHGDRDLVTDETVTMWFDSFEVMYLDSAIDTVPTAFTARPTVTYAGGAYTVTPNVSASHIEYRWYADGVPIVPAITATYTTPELSKLRVHVKAKSLINQPEAWTVETA